MLDAEKIAELKKIYSDLPSDQKYPLCVFSSSKYYGKCAWFLPKSGD